MAVAFTYTPPKVNGLAVIHAAKTAAELAGAEVLLKVSQPLVPEDKGALVASGSVEHSLAGAEVKYSAASDDGYDYAGIQHERMDYHHDKGQAKYLEQPMHTEAAAILAVMATVAGRVL